MSIDEKVKWDLRNEIAELEQKLAEERTWNKKQAKNYAAAMAKLERAAKIAESYGKTWGENYGTSMVPESSQLPGDEIAKAIRAMTAAPSEQGE